MNGPTVPHTNDWLPSTIDDLEWPVNEIFFELGVIVHATNKSLRPKDGVGGNGMKCTLRDIADTAN